MVLNETPAPSVRHHNRGTAAVAALLVLFSLLVALGSIQRSELGVSGHGLVASDIHVQFTGLVGLVGTALSLIALALLHRQES